MVPVSRSAVRRRRRRDPRGSVAVVRERAQSRANPPVRRGAAALARTLAGCAGPGMASAVRGVVPTEHPRIPHTSPADPVRFLALQRGGLHTRPPLPPRRQLRFCLLVRSPRPSGSAHPRGLTSGTRRGRRLTDLTLNWELGSTTPADPNESAYPRPCLHLYSALTSLCGLWRHSLYFMSCE
uniref:Uncharacterized protein n=1 Tax=Mustela putorius furo TaxID=9669 RepID=M3XQW1_MUSPF